MNIRYGNTKDAELLSQLGAKTFLDTFAKDNTPKNIDLYLRESFSPEIQRRDLSSPNVLFQIAESEGMPVGYAQLIIDSRIENINGIHPLEIRRIYAIQDFVGRGVGGELMKAAIDESRKRGCDCIWLGVWEKNSRAISFYKKWGFRQVGTHLFMLGDDPQNDFIMELDL